MWIPAARRSLWRGTGSFVLAAAAPFPTAAAGEAALTVEGSGTVPSASEAVSGALALLEQLLPEGGETTLYLSAFRRTESETHLTFSYQFNGVPIHFADGSAAAEIILTGNHHLHAVPAAHAVP